MYIPLRPLFLLHADRELRGVVGEALRGHFHPLELEDWESVRDAVAEAPPGAVIVVDPYFGTNGNGSRAPADGLRKLLEDFPSAPIVAALDPDRDGYSGVWELREWGVAEVLPLGEERSAVAIRNRVRAAQAKPLRHFLAEDLPGPLPGRARAILDAAVETVIQGGYPRDLAGKLGMSGPTLLRWCNRAELPSPRRLLHWLRVLLAAALLDDPGHTVFSVALACGYSTDDSLRRAIRGLVPHPPTELREQGAFRTVSDAFLRELQAA